MVQQRSSSRSQAHHRVDVTHHQGLLVIQRRQEAQQGRGQHGFAAAWWSHQQQVMPTGRGQLHCAAALALAEYLLQINPHERRLAWVQLGPGGPGGSALQRRHHSAEAAGWIQGQRVEHRRLAGIGLRKDQT